MGPVKQLKKMFETTRLLATIVMIVSERGQFLNLALECFACFINSRAVLGLCCGSFLLRPVILCPSGCVWRELGLYGVPKPTTGWGSCFPLCTSDRVAPCILGEN